MPSGRDIRNVACVLAAAALLGCAAAPQRESSPLDRPGAVQAVAIVVGPATGQAGLPAVVRRDPATGAIAGGATGAWLALVAAPLVLIAAGPAAILAAPALGTIVAAGVAAGAVAGAALGSSAAAAIDEKSASATSRLEAVLQLGDLPAQAVEAIRAQIATLTDLRAEILGEPGAPADDAGTGALARERGLPVVVALRGAGLWLAHDYLGRPWSGPLAAEARFVMAAGAAGNLLDSATGRVIASRGFLVESESYSVDEWMRDDAALARRERDTLVRALAERVVETFLLQAGLELRASATCGVVPHEPRFAWPFSRLNVPRVASLTPGLAWEARPGTPASLAPPDGATGFGYDLRVWKVENERLAGLAVERLGLRQPYYRFEEPLAPNAQYAWSVRVRYTVDGSPRAGRWSAVGKENVFARSMAVGLPWYAGAQGDAVAPQRCLPDHMHACGCLDFLPLERLWRFATP